MAVQDEDSFKRYVANGVATVYAIPFLLLSASDLQVTLDAVPVTSGFTVSGVGSNTGSITFDAAPTGDLLLQRVVPFERLTDYQDNGDLLAQTVNRDFDRLWLAMQELRRDDSTALRTSSLEPEGIPNLPLAAQRSSRVLAFGPTGDPVVSSLTLDELEQQPALAIAAADAAVAAAGAASSSASASAASATASENSAIASAQAKDKAQQWAEEDEDVPVEPGLFSAKHWAAKAMAALSGLTASVSDLLARRLTIGGSTATTSGTSHDVTGLPSNLKTLDVTLSGVSTNGTSVIVIRLGSGSIVATGYLAVGAGIVGAAVASLDFTTGFGITNDNAAANTYSGTIRFTRVTGNTWVCDGMVRCNSSGRIGFCSGEITLGGALDRFRVTTANGTDVFDGGSFSYQTQG